MLKRTFVVANALGLHARAAGKLARCAQGFSCSIVAVKKEKYHNMKRLLDIMLMGSVCGESIQMEFDGPDEQQAAQALQEQFESQFGEPN